MRVMNSFWLNLLHTDRRLIALTFLAILSFGFEYSLHGPLHVQFFPDSSGYIDNSALRTRGYPLIVNLLKILGEMSALGWIQYFVLVLAAIGFSFQASSILGLPLACIMLLGVLLNPEITKYARYALPDSLFMSSVMVVGSLIFSLVRFGPTARLSILIGAMLSATYLLRPVGIALLIPVMIVAVVLFQAGRVSARHLVGKFSVGVAAAIVSAVMVSTMSDALKERVPSNYSMLALSLAGKVAFLSPDRETEVFSTEKAAFDAYNTEARRTFQQLSSPHHQLLFALSRYDDVRFNSLRRFEQKLENNTKSKIDDDLLRFSVTLIKDDLSAYSYDVMLNYMSAWFLGELITSEELKDFKISLEFLGGAPLAKGLSPRHFAIVWFERAFLAISFVTVCSLLLYLLYRIIRKHPISDELVWLGALGGFIHAYFLLISLFGAGIARYSLVAQPLLLLFLLALISYGYGKILSKRLWHHG